MFSRLALGAKRYLFVAMLTLLSLAPALSFPAPARAADPFPVDFSRVEVNSQKQAQYRADIFQIYSDLKSQIGSLGKSRVIKAFVFYPWDVQKISPSTQDGFTAGYFQPSTGYLVINSVEFEETESVRTVIAHELLHSFVPANNGYGYSGAGGKGYVYEEMLADYFSKLHIGASLGETYAGAVASLGYSHLANLVPQILNIIGLAGQSDPETILERAIFSSSKLGLIDQTVGKYLTDKNFLANLGGFLDTSPAKTNLTAAKKYLDEVERKILATSAKSSSVQVLVKGQFSADYADVLTIPENVEGLSIPLEVALSAAPSSPVTLTVAGRGALVLTYTGSADLVFDSTNFADSKSFRVFYDKAANKEGTRAEISFSGPGVDTKTVTVVKASELKSGPAGGTTGGTGGTAGGTTAAASGVGPFLGKFLLPDCLRTGEKAVNAEFDTCVLDSVRHYIELLLLLTALGAFGYLLYGAFLYASAFGDEAKATLAKKVITAALIGAALSTLAYLAIMLLAQGLGVEGGLLRTP